MVDCFNLHNAAVMKSRTVCIGALLQDQGEGPQTQVSCQSSSESVWFVN